MGTRNSKKGKELKTLDEMIAEITVDAYGDDEQLWAFRQAFEDDVTLPADGFVIWEPVSVIAVDYDGNERRGLTARCRRECRVAANIGWGELHCCLPEVAQPRSLSFRNEDTFPTPAAAQGG